LGLTMHREERLLARLQGLARPSPSCPSYIGARERERRERAGSGPARATEVWGRAGVLERAVALIGGWFGEGGVREKEGKILACFASGTMNSFHPQRTNVTLQHAG
jgi:hypothetical protein